MAESEAAAALTATHVGHLTGVSGADFASGLALLTVPSPPLNVVSSGPSYYSIFVSWNTPLSDGGSPITSYVIERSVDGGAWTYASAVGPTFHSKNITSLSPGRSYRFRVKASNSEGQSNASAATTPLSTLPLPRAR